MFISNNLEAIKGLKMENNLPQQLAIPLAVPLTSAGNASGVQPYKTELNMDWKKYSMTLRPTLAGWVSIAAKRKNDVAIKRDEKIMAHRLPTRGTLTMRAPRLTATIPGIYMMIKLR